MLLIAAIVAVCVLFFIGAFVAPQLSKKPQGKTDRGLTKLVQKSRNAPGFLGKIMPKSFGTAEKAVDKSAESGRKNRGKTKS
jgi:lipopolysaccharide export LptBFGC system permease protein LptF